MTREYTKKILASNRMTILNYKMEKISDDVSIGLVTRSDEGKQYNIAMNIIDNIFDYFEAKIAELEAQNKVLTDMVEMQSEKISRLETPKSCGNCIYSIESDDGYDYYCQVQQDYFNAGMCCDKYEPKDN